MPAAVTARVNERMSSESRFLVYHLPALLYMGLIFIMSSGPVTSPIADLVPDYVLHGLGFAVLYLLVFWAIHEGFVASARRGGYWLPVLITILYGASDEFHQTFVPSRDASLLDLSADAAGALIGLLVIVLAALAVKAGSERSDRSIRSN